MTTITTDTDPAEAGRVQFDRQAMGLRTNTPGVVAQATDGASVAVQPAVSLAQRLEDVQTVPLPVVRGVPLHVYGSTTADVFVCVPVLPGDDGLLAVCDRALDNWQFGEGVNAPPEAASPRHHDLTDAVFVPGLQRAADTIPDYPTTGIELRTRDGTTKLSVEPGAITGTVGTASVSLTAAGLTVTVGGKTLTWDASGLTIDGHAYLSHHHGGVQTGPGNTGNVIP